MPTSSTTTGRAPLSSLRLVPATEETQGRMRDAGIRFEPGLTEHGAQALLALRIELDGGEAGAPACYQRAYDPTADLCAGCVFQPRCWRSDLAYLHRLGDGKVAPPPGVPEQVVLERIAHGRDRALPPAAPTRRPAPPPPPARTRPEPPPPPVRR